MYFELSVGRYLVVLVYSAAIFSAVSVNSAPTPSEPDSSEEQCLPIRLDLCRDIGYTLARLPNRFQQSQEQADVRLRSLYPLARMVCSAEIREFVCRTILPECENEERNNRRLVETCSAARSECNFLFTMFGLKRPVSADCSGFIASLFSPTPTPTTTPVRIYSTSESFGTTAPNIATTTTVTSTTPTPTPTPTHTHTHTPTPTPAPSPTHQSATRPPTEVVAAGNDETCESITVPLCHGLAYNKTRMPTRFNHETQEEAGLEADQFYPLIRINCSAELREFICRLYVPECERDVENSRRIAEICPVVERDCEGIMRKFGLSWPERLSCDRSATDELIVSTAHQSSVSTPTANDQCENLTLSFCQGVGYSAVRLPNFLDQETQEEIGLEIGRFTPLIKMQCSAELREFLCRLYVPECGREEENARRLAETCPLARRGCAPLMRQFGFQWPERFACDSFTPQGRAIPSPSSDNQCVSFNGIHACRNLAYDRIQYPNLLGHRDFSVALDEFNNYSGFLDSNCSRALPTFLCRLYFPECNSSLNGEILKRKCSLAWGQCRDVMQSVGFDWPNAWACWNF